LTIEPVTRIEGHAKITIEMNDDDEIVDGRLQVLEIRGFEKFVQKMELVKMPLITARICGVCPAAHHLAAVTAIENGCRVSPPQEAAALRELLFHGHILHSHALSCFVLLGPDIISGIGAQPAQRSIFHLLSTQPDLAKKALRLRSIGQKVVETVGGRGIHPVIAIPGGMASQPTSDEIKNIMAWGNEAIGILEEIRPSVLEMLRKLAEVRPATAIDALPLALSNDGTVDFLKGECRVMNDKGGVERSFQASGYGDHFLENVMPGSYMKSVRLKGREERTFFVGPLARLMANGAFTTPRATALLQEFKKNLRPVPSLLDIIESRCIEMVHCSERMVELASRYKGGTGACAPLTPREGRYVGVVEAPRGILIHDYTADGEGRVVSANLIVATQNNYDAINRAIVSIARHFRPLKDENTFLNGIEFAVRCFDPCLSCATHASGRMPMVVELKKNGKTVSTITKE
jgi:F420-non-reducing hydrogenase large subunit